MLVARESRVLEEQRARSQAAGHAYLLGDAPTAADIFLATFLTALAGQITEGLFGQRLDGNGDGTPGDNYVFSPQGPQGLFRYYGDANGDRRVDVVDLGAFGLHTPMWRRQTPKQLFHRFGPSAGALLWGLDTGLVVTTFRVTSLSWAALALAALGLVPWWSGLLYAIGFTVPAAALVLAVPAHPWSPEDLQEPVWLQYRIMALEPAMRRVALLALLAGAATAGALTVWGMA